MALEEKDAQLGSVNIDRWVNLQSTATENQTARL